MCIRDRACALQLTASSEPSPRLPGHASGTRPLPGQARSSTAARYYAGARPHVQRAGQLWLTRSARCRRVGVATPALCR
eukprot:14980864-Alexandrium_andersonii.AAC.1